VNMKQSATVCELARVIASMHHSLRQWMAHARAVSSSLESITIERDVMLRELASLRADLDEHVSLIHRLCDERSVDRVYARTMRAEMVSGARRSDELRNERNELLRQRRCDVADRKIVRSKKAKRKR
jgi:hypothetical protein